MFANTCNTTCSAPLVLNSFNLALGGDVIWRYNHFLLMGLARFASLIRICIPRCIKDYAKAWGLDAKIRDFPRHFTMLNSFWLLTVLSEQISLSLLLLVIGLIGLAGLAILMSKIFQLRLLLGISAILALCAVIASNGPSFLPEQNRSSVATTLYTTGGSNLDWKSFDEGQISKHVNAGKPSL